MRQHLTPKKIALAVVILIAVAALLFSLFVLFNVFVKERYYKRGVEAALVEMIRQSEVGDVKINQGDKTIIFKRMP